VCSRVGFARASLELLSLTNARAILDDGVKVAGLVLDAVVVVVEMVDIGHVVMVQVCSFQGLAATEICSPQNAYSFTPGWSFSV
jgi:hypothetical protein